MAVNFDVPITWKEFKALGKEEQHDYLQHLIDTYGANAVSFAKMFKTSANTVRRYLAENNVGIKLSRGRRVDTARWNEFLGIREPVTEEPAAQPDPMPIKHSGTVHACTKNRRNPSFFGSPGTGGNGDFQPLGSQKVVRCGSTPSTILPGTAKWYLTFCNASSILIALQKVR